MGGGDMAAAAAQVRALLSAARSVVVLTGAGVSAESGIPTFRGEGGWWRKYDATTLATPQAFARDPSSVWEFYHYRREVTARCAPNPAHVALAAFERRAAAEGRRFTLVTQNIDRLHHDAGSRAVIELHGSLWDVVAATPGGGRDPATPPREDRTQPLVPALAGTGDPDGQAADIPIEDLPHDGEGRLLRPGVVWFEEPLDDRVLDAVEEALDGADLLLVVGTSSVVWPAAGFAPQVAARGVPVVEVNLEPTNNSAACTHSLQGRAGELLPGLLGVADEPDVAAAVAAAARRRAQRV
ncbi:sirt5 [Scenedesmus sp. PABB004]|nr:sirt5 [Scenedesmus sp. PABB004]